MTLVLPAEPEFGEALAPAPSPEVLRFLATRRSVSAANLTEPAPSSAEIQDLLRLAVRAPDHGKLTPWRFILLDARDKARFVEALEALARSRGDLGAIGKLAKLRIPPLAIAVIASPQAQPIPEWEQTLSAGAVCTNLLYATLAMGYGANWITGWYAYDPQAQAILGLRDGEKVAGFMLMGTPHEPPLERARPDTAALVMRWQG